MYCRIWLILCQAFSRSISVTWKVTLFDHVFQVDFQINIQRSKGIWVWIRSDHIGEGKRFSFDIQKYFFLLSVRSILLALVSFMMDYSRIIRFDFLKNNPLIRNMIDLLWKVQLVFRYSFDPVTDWFWIVLESNIYAVDCRDERQMTSN